MFCFGSDCPGVHEAIDQAALKLTEIHRLGLLSARTKGLCTTLVRLFFILSTLKFKKSEFHEEKRMQSLNMTNILVLSKCS